MYTKMEMEICLALLVPLSDLTSKYLAISLYCNDPPLYKGPYSTTTLSTRQYLHSILIVFFFVFNGDNGCVRVDGKKKTLPFFSLSLFLLLVE